MRSRLQNLRTQFDRLNFHSFLVTFQPHVRYLSGFTGSSGVCLVTLKSASLVTDGRYAQQVKHEVKGWRVFIAQESLFEGMRKSAKGGLRSGSRVGIDGNSLTLAQYRHLKKLYPEVRFIPTVDVIEKLTAVKDSDEIEKIKKAVAITDRVFSDILELVKPNVKELDIAAEITYRHRKYGADGDAFEQIVASGERSALPHGRPTAKKLRHGEFITIDLGCVYQGYHSDMTRTVAIGKPTSEAKKIYNTVLDAQRKAIGAAKSGMKTKELDAVARNFIKAQGYEKYFRHSLGHGIGLQIHESPRISVQSKYILQEGNVVTIEPGVYVPNLGGVRIEDDVVITNGHCEVLNRSPKELIIL